MRTPEQALEHWGVWARRGSCSVGWPQGTALGKRVEGRLGGSGWDAGAGFDDDSQALATDKLIATLPRELRRLLVLHYVESGEPEEKAAELGTPFEAYLQAVGIARARFAGLLN